MNSSIYENIARNAKALDVDLSEEEIGRLVSDGNFSEENLNVIDQLFSYLEKKRNDETIETCLRLSRLPRKEPKTFDGFDFSRLKSKEIDKLVNISTLSPLYARKTVAFIGPQGIGKTHLAMAFGNACCQLGMKVYYIKANELNDKLMHARRIGNPDKVVSSMVKPSCLIIDEVGRCVFDEENTRYFFDIVDRRAEKEGPNCMIFTSNKAPNTWNEYFLEKDSLLCSLDRIFDDALVFMMKGKSYRGRKLETIAIETEN